MEIVQDFAHHTNERATACTAEQLERLTSCYRKALGHELPNLLVGLQGLARTLELEQGQKLDEEGRLFLQRLIQAAQKADTLVRTLAGLGKLCEAGAEPETVALDDLLEEAVAEVGLTCRGQAVRWQVQRGMPTVRIVRAGLHYAVVQLLRNAVQAGPRTIQLEAERTGQGVELRVCDDGAGMTPEQMLRLFQPFGQGRNPKGSFGLGLFAVRQLVASWGGTLCIRSEPGEGTRVSVHFPGDLT